MSQADEDDQKNKNQQSSELNEYQPEKGETEGIFDTKE
jgi:hypothetical protein